MLQCFNAFFNKCRLRYFFKLLYYTLPAKNSHGDF